MITSYQSRFNELQDLHLISKSKHFAKWTIPYLMPELNDDGKQLPIEGDFQSVGALLVNALSSKLSGLLFPSTYPFMAVNLTDEGREALNEALEEQGRDAGELPHILARVVTEASNKAFEGNALYQLILALKYLIVLGNVAIYRDTADNSISCYGLNNFVTRRDGTGKVVEAIIKESLFFKSLDEDLQKQLIAKNVVAKDDTGLDAKPIAIYTRIVREGVYFKKTVGVEDAILSDDYSEEWEIEQCPYIFPTWSLIKGEHYGRGLVEELRGDFAKLSALSEALTLYEIEMMHVVYLVGAESFDAVDDLMDAATGEWIRCSPSAVSVHETGSGQKVQQILEDLDIVFTRLARAMMWQGNTRDGERVTAYEIQQEILEVEAAMGGVYSALSESLQLPLAKLLTFEVAEIFIEMLLLTKAGSITVTAGLNALGRTTKATNILEVLAQAGQAVEIATQIDKRIDPTKIVDLFFESRGIDLSEILKSAEQLQAEAEAELQEAQAMQQMEQGTAIGNMANQMNITEGGL